MHLLFYLLALSLLLTALLFIRTGCIKQRAMRQLSELIDNYNDLVLELSELDQNLLTVLQIYRPERSFEQYIEKQRLDISAALSKLNTCLSSYIQTKSYKKIISEQEKILEELDELYDKKTSLTVILYKLKEGQKEQARTQRFSERKEEYDKEHNFIYLSQAISYFDGCTTKKEIERKYRQLIKKYHPDNGGDANTFIKIQEEYSTIKQQI